MRTGGSYRIVMRAPDGASELEVTGTYRDVDPPRRLVFSWRWERGFEDPTESLVTVELAPRGDRTELSLTHAGFPDADTAAPYGDGWGYSLPRLAAHFAGR